MRFSLAALPVLAAHLAAALPAPQDIDLDMVAAMPDPTYSEAVGVTAQIVTYNPTSLAAQATSAVSSVSIEVSDVLSSTAEVKKHKRTACAPQPTGVSSYAVSPDNPTAFASNTVFASKATNAPTPSGYTQQFQNLNASNNAYGYMGFTTLPEYDVPTCAKKCDAINGCMSFNLYFERDPSVDPGSGASGCVDPSSVTMIKCVFWGGPVTQSNANNYGQFRNQFQVLIAGSNGYTNNSIIVPPGFTGATYLGNAAINAPYDAQGYNTFMASTIFTQGGYNATLCALYCQSQTAYNVATAPQDGTPPKICNFFNTYILWLNGTSAQGQYCALYTEAWASSYATNTGQYRGSDVYTVDHSYAYTNSSNQAPAPSAGNKVGAIYQARQDMTYFPSSLTSTFMPFCSSVLGYTPLVASATASATVTPVVSSTVTVLTTVTAAANAKRSLYTPGVLTKYPASVVSSACSLIATSPISTSTTTVTTVTATAATSTTLTTTVSTSTVYAQQTLPVFRLKNTANGYNGFFASSEGGEGSLEYLDREDAASTFSITSSGNLLEASSGLYVALGTSLNALQLVDATTTKLPLLVCNDPVAGNAASCTAGSATIFGLNGSGYLALYSPDTLSTEKQSVTLIYTS